jgi:hypothetical protein
MNKQLIQQFLDKACYDETAQQNLEDWCDVEKLAELIVKECTDFLKDTLDDHFAAEQLEEHFGVER